jgi:hypothetical protein
MLLKHLYLLLKNSSDWIYSFMFGKWIDISDGQQFPIVVNMRNGLDF